MNIEISIGKDSNDSERQRMKIDGKHRLTVAALCECPEDAIIGRDLVSCRAVSSYMREAYEAGKRGDEFNVAFVAETDDDDDM